MKRRDFLAASAASMTLAMLGPRMALAASASPATIGVQLYTLRQMMAESVPATLKEVAKIGYQHVEFAGYFDESPESVRSILDGEGLQAPAMHVSLDLLENRLEPTLEVAKIIGHRYVVLPFLFPQQRSSIDDYYRLAENLNRWGEVCNSTGLRLAYHNHDFEFSKTEGSTMESSAIENSKTKALEPFDVLLNETESDKLFFELDLYWAIRAGKNPIDYFKNSPGRFPLWHLKDMAENGAMADVGSGTIDFVDLFKFADTAGYQFGFVEHDFTREPIATIKNSYQALQRMGRL